MEICQVFWWMSDSNTRKSNSLTMYNSNTQIACKHWWVTRIKSVNNCDQVIKNKCQLWIELYCITIYCNVINIFLCCIVLYRVCSTYVLQHNYIFSSLTDTITEGSQSTTQANPRFYLYLNCFVTRSPQITSWYKMKCRVLPKESYYQVSKYFHWVIKEKFYLWKFWFLGFLMADAIYPYVHT